MELELERQLVERAKCDPQAFGALYDEYFGQIFGYVLRRTASITIAQDVTAEVFFKALRNIKGFQWRGIPFSDWLYRIAIHEIANVYTHNGHDRVLTTEMKLSLAVFDASVETGAEEAEARLQQESDLLALHKSISKLPQKYQEVITLRFFEKKQLNEIARILGKREGTIKSLVHRGLERLRSLMEETSATF
jgi:RNA polymerase sigma-70 factor (ECF subfamily)